MARKADNETLNGLHSKIADHFLKILASGDTTAAELAVMVKFLKDNNIEANLEQAPKLGDIEKRLPFTEATARH